MHRIRSTTVTPQPQAPRLACLAALAALLLFSAGTGRAQEAGIRTTFVPLGPNVPGVLYQPLTTGDRAQVGLVVMHPFSSSLAHLACGELATRGYTVLCANPHTVPLDDYTYTIEEQAPDIARAVTYLRDTANVRSVVLLGHSAGGPMLAFYQAVAENGPAICQGPEKIWRCPDSLAGLPPADGLLLLDSHAGTAFATLTYVDPAIVEERDPTARNPELDMFDARNGYSALGAEYSADFRARFHAGQGARHNRLATAAQDRWAAIQAGTGLYPDDEPFLVHAAGAARLFQPDLALQARTRDPHRVLHPDGSVTTDVVRTVRVPSGASPRAAASYDAALAGVTVRQFLSSHAIRTSADYEIGPDFIRGVDWASSSTSAPWSVEHIRVPLLIMPMTGHYFLVADELIFDRAASPDKQLAFVEGAAHGLTPCRPCEPTPGAFGDTVKTLFDFADGWLAARF